MGPDWSGIREGEKEGGGRERESHVCIHVQVSTDIYKGIDQYYNIRYDSVKGNHLMEYVIESLTVSSVLGTTIKPYSFASQRCIVVSAKHPDGIFNLAHSLRPMAIELATHGVLAVCSTYHMCIHMSFTLQPFIFL